jgi:hypothetical protein
MGNKSKPLLTIEHLCKEAKLFAETESKCDEPIIYGVTDGKAVGTYFEHKFKIYLSKRYRYKEGNTAKGIDFPELNVDMKVTSIRQPQSSCPYKNARQKIYGLGYSLLVFVYKKTDDSKKKVGKLFIHHTIFVEAERTGDYQTTTGIRKITNNNGNKDDIAAFLQERMLPVDDIQAWRIAEEILKEPPKIGYLTISNALQWRLQYRRVIEQAGNIKGVNRIQ